MSKPFYQFAGVLSFLQALIYLCLAIIAYYISREQFQGDFQQLAQFYIQNPLCFTLFCSSFIALAFLGFIAVAPATAGLFPKNDWAIMGRNLALLCLSVTGIYFSGVLVVAPQLISALKWVAWFTFGGMGLWVAIVALLAFYKHKLSNLFIAASIVKTIGFWTLLIGILTQNITTLQIGIVLGALIGGPLYHIMLGNKLMKGR